MKIMTTRPRRKFTAVTFLAVVMLWSPLATAEGLSEKEILSALPKGSVIARVPTEFAENGRILANKSAVIPVSLLPGKDVQVIVGYYTEPDPGKGQPIRNESAFFTRCHVALVARTKNRFQILWDSGGWGCSFGMRPTPTENRFNDDQIQLFFHAKDLNGDGMLEIVYSRVSFGAEGSCFEIWEYDTTEKKLIQVCNLSGSVTLIDSPGVKWPKIEATSFHASTVSTVSMEYDSNIRRYKQRKKK